MGKLTKLRISKVKKFEYHTSLNNVLPWIMFPFLKKLTTEKRTWFDFCTFEIASLVNVPRHYWRKYGEYFFQKGGIQQLRGLNFTRFWPSHPLRVSKMDPSPPLLFTYFLNAPKKVMVYAGLGICKAQTWHFCMIHNQFLFVGTF